MIEKVWCYNMVYQMLQPGDRVIVALSGGADSVCLLSVLKDFTEVEGGMDLELKAVHIHHGLRGEDADRDADFARGICVWLDVPFTVVRRDVAGYAREHGLSTEEAGRILRYEVLEEEAKAWGADKIALAHHMNDSAETIIHHLVRGSGLRGLSGIRPVQGNRIRPLLCADREEIEEYLTESGLGWREDASNAALDYTRNRIRHQVMPMLESAVNERAVENILRAGETFFQADQYLEGVAKRIWDQAGSGGEGEVPKEVSIPVKVLLEQEAIIRTYLYRHMMDLLQYKRKNVTAGHYWQMDDLLYGNTGARCDLPGGYAAERRYEEFCIGNTGAMDTPAKDLPQSMHFETFPLQNGLEIPKNQYTKWFDYDKIEGTLSVRKREPGDYITLVGGGKKTLHRYMIDEKIPKRLRDEITILADGNHVLWIVGYRISEYHKITEDTKTILQVTADGGEEHGR